MQDKTKKMCNYCGSMVSKYKVIGNGIFCTKCSPKAEEDSNKSK